MSSPGCALGRGAAISAEGAFAVSFQRPLQLSSTYSKVAFHVIVVSLRKFVAVKGMQPVEYVSPP